MIFFYADLAELVHDCAVSSSVDFPVYLSHFQYSWNKLSGEDGRQVMTKQVYVVCIVKCLAHYVKMWYMIVSVLPLYN